MAVITKTDAKGVQRKVITEVTLTSSDTLPYTEGRNSILILRNPTGSTINATATGSLSTLIGVQRYGLVDAGVGYPMSLTAGQARVFVLDDIASWLEGTVTITSGTGLIAQFIEH